MLWVGLLAVFSLLFGVWGYLAARSRGRTPIVWALVCAFTFFIGIAIVYSLGDPLLPEHGQDYGHDRGAVQDAMAHGDADADDEPTQRRHLQLPAIQPPLPVTIATGEPNDDRRWRYLCEYHPRISEAVRRIEPLGQEALDELKSAYLVLNDATLLPGVLRRLDERFGGGQRGYSMAGDFGRALAPPTVGEEDEPIELHAPGSGHALGESAERGTNGANGLRTARSMPSEMAIEMPPPPAQEYRSLRDTSADAEREQTAWRTAFEKDRMQRPDSAAVITSTTPTSNASVLASAQSQVPQQDRLPQDKPVERNRLTTALNGGAAGAVTSQPPIKDSPTRSERREETPQQQQRVQTPPPPLVEALLVTRPPEHRTVSPAELVGARYLETFGGLHLFALVDGRVFVDRHEALGSLELARTYVDGLKPKHAEA